MANTNIAFDSQSPYPANAEVERHALGCIILDNSLLTSSGIQVEDMFLVSHRNILGAMFDLERDGTVVDPVTLQVRLGERGQLEYAGGAAYIASLFDGVPRFSDISSKVKILRNLRQRRNLIKLGSSAAYDAESGEFSPDDIKQRVRQLLDELDAGERKSRPVHDVLEGALNRAAVPGLATGFYELDKLLRGGGLVPGDLLIIAARTTRGKSTLATQIAANICDRYDQPQYKNGGPVGIYIGLESDNEDILERALTMRAELSYKSLQSGLYTPEEAARRNATIKRMANWRLMMCDFPYMRIEDIRRELEAATREYKRLDFVIIDYLGLVAGHNERYERREQLENLTRQLKLLAKFMSVPIILPAQVNREGDSGRITLANLRGSGSIEQDATKVLILQEPQDETSPSGYYGLATLDKQRRGTAGHFRYFFNKRFGRIEEVPNSGTQGMPDEGEFKTANYGKGKGKSKKGSLVTPDWED